MFYMRLNPFRNYERTGSLVCLQARSSQRRGSEFLFVGNRLACSVVGALHVTPLQKKDRSRRDLPCYNYMVPRSSRGWGTLRCQEPIPDKMLFQIIKCIFTQINRMLSNCFFNTNQLVIFRNTIRTTERTCLDLTCSRRNYNIGDSSVFSFTRTM